MANSARRKKMPVLKLRTIFGYNHEQFESTKKCEENFKIQTFFKQRYQQGQQGKENVSHGRLWSPKARHLTISQATWSKETERFPKWYYSRRVFSVIKSRPGSWARQHWFLNSSRTRTEGPKTVIFTIKPFNEIKSRIARAGRVTIYLKASGELCKEKGETLKQASNSALVNSEFQTSIDFFFKGSPNYPLQLSKFIAGSCDIIQRLCKSKT